MQKITVLVSGGGTNLQAIIDAIESGEIENAKIVQVISSNSKAFSLERAKKHGICAKVIGKEVYSDPMKRSEALLCALKEERTDLVVLAGYMSVLDVSLIQEYEGRMINIHPSLIPKYCGKGYYGKRVHQAVLDNGESTTGATVHFVDEGVDTGEIILQERVPVQDEDTADTLAARVLVTEHKILIEAIKKLTEEKNRGGK
ncbi:phosphoribosylglycinamide formyltransferase [Sinanaerobacter sp. ZZT-01]|uniref:phosphoribosylglycinamide formyltransferase n=1 Tax=Sinanaerobacter sp. ZZT-01 TaxID=3111540 RepID=UPI002D7A2443|nr:phosphoribosylglycinamide formyltransferase [Sinanaerobacter sp. ZZT-01]WRR94573.1 phosphoribosylglycinamide formyltransferase [Sinanaerobacter sp. ZZT-01]